MGFPHSYLQMDTGTDVEYPWGETGPDERIYTLRIGVPSPNAYRNEPRDMTGRKLRAKLRDSLPMRAMWRHGASPRSSHQRATVLSAQSPRHVMSHLPWQGTRLSPAHPHLMESRMRGQRACPVWGEG